MSKIWLMSLAVAMAACAPAERGEISVFAAASLSEGLTEAALLYERGGGGTVIFNFGASGILARQIANGAPADLFASADAERMDVLQRGQFLDAGTRVSFLSNALVLVVLRERTLPVRLEELTRIAIADPRTVPAGNYAKSYMQRIGQWDQLAARMIPTENVRGALAAVVSGNVDGAFVYKTDALISQNVKIAFVAPQELVPPITYPFAVPRGAGNADGAKRFLAFLQTPAALDVFRRRGFIVGS